MPTVIETKQKNADISKPNSGHNLGGRPRWKEGLFMPKDGGISKEDYKVNKEDVKVNKEDVKVNKEDVKVNK